MGNLLTFNYWVNLRPGNFTPIFQKYFIILISIFLLFYIISLLLKSKNKNFYIIWKKLSTLFITNFIIGLLLLFFNYEMVPFLSSRFWFLIWATTLIVWFYFIAKEFIKIPNIKQQLEKDKEFKKYIP